MGSSTKLKLAAFGGAMAMLGLVFGYSTASSALEQEDCLGRPHLISAAYGVCR
jgi:hypothetical protein